MIAYPVTESSQVGHVRRSARQLARSAGLDETDIGKVALITNELATNLVRHAGGGEIVIQETNPDEQAGIQVLAVDRGPGINDLPRSLEDGYSTGGSRGAGLGAVKRLANVFDIYSRPDHGTVILAQVTGKEKAVTRHGKALMVSAVSVAKPGELCSGDAWTCRQRADHSRIMVVDGLGHGSAASEAARATVQVFRGHNNLSLESLISQIHYSIRRTRGAALAIAEINAGQAEVHYAGIGNIGGRITGLEKTQNLISVHGIVGHSLDRSPVFKYSYGSDTGRSGQPLLIMHSDGIRDGWNLNQYSGLFNRHPGLIAGVLYRDFKRETDDIIIVVVRLPQHDQPLNHQSAE